MMGFDFALVDMRVLQRMIHQHRFEPYMVLSEVELTCVERFSFPKKKLQWISGRVAVKTALFKHKVTRGRIMDPCCINLLNGIDRAPYIQQFPKLSISITHSYPYCIGLVSTTRVGIDLERLFTPRQAMLDQYYHPHELQELQNKMDLTEFCRQATTYWTRKEAFSKLLGLGLKMDFKTIDTVNDILYLDSNPVQSVRLRSFARPDFCLTVAVEEERVPSVESNVK